MKKEFTFSFGNGESRSIHRPLELPASFQNWTRGLFFWFSGPPLSAPRSSLLITRLVFRRKQFRGQTFARFPISCAQPPPAIGPVFFAQPGPLASPIQGGTGFIFRPFGQKALEWGRRLRIFITPGRPNQPEFEASPPFFGQKIGSRISRPKRGRSARGVLGTSFFRPGSPGPSLVPGFGRGVENLGIEFFKKSRCGCVPN